MKSPKKFLFLILISFISSAYKTNELWNTYRCIVGWLKMHDVFRYWLPGHFWEGLYVKWSQFENQVIFSIFNCAHFGVFGPPGPHRGGWPPDPKFFLGSLGVPNRHNFTHWGQWFNSFIDFLSKILASFFAP